ncbi:MAG: V-type ATP synthase subunit F [Candidatus Micrarchaeia archaeon]
MVDSKEDKKISNGNQINNTNKTINDKENNIDLNNNINYYKIAVVGNNLLSKSMKLIGIKHIYNISNESIENIEKIIEKIILDENIGIVIINEGITEKLVNKRLIRMIDSSLKPIFIEIPDYNKPEIYTDALKRLIIRAIGVDISKK